MFNDRLRSTRIARGFTLQQTADVLHTGLRNYQKYESGHASPTFDGLVKLADFLDVPVDYLLCRDDYLKALGVSVDVARESPPRRPKAKMHL